MYPWLLFWAPQINFPFSGDLAQKIDPKTNWFTDHIETDAGDPKIEEQAFRVATYGKQLGLITELLLDIAERDKQSLSGEGASARERLMHIKDEINGLKISHATDPIAELYGQLAELKSNQPAAYRSLLDKIEAPSSNA